MQKIGDDYGVPLNEGAVPRLRLAGYYQRVLSDSAVAADTKEYLQERLRSARWLVKSIYQRQQTIFKVASSIVKFQRAFFDHGITHLRPLVLKDVAEDIGMHESTISRATVAIEQHHDPLSDQAIAEVLRRDQINIARRTVAKYRQALGILPSARRKKVS